MTNYKPCAINIHVKSNYLPEQSEPEKNYYVFSYTVTINNQSDQAAKLISRHWIVTDAQGNTQEVKGIGVIGEQPHLKPGETYEYTSVAVINSPVGSMQGSYQMVNDDGTTFDAPIHPFSLAQPTMIH